MLHRIFGASGSGKTTYLLQQLKAAVKQKRRCFFIVPEQQSVACERRLCRELGDSVSMYCEVLNFERLPNRVARDYGGLAASYIDKGGRDLLMALSLARCAPKLTEYSSVCTDPDFVRSCVSAVNRFKAEGISSDTLRELSDSSAIDDQPRLKRKLFDMSMICKSYTESFSEGLRDPLDALDTLAHGSDIEKFFSGTCVFVDGYYTFTGVEYEILDCMTRSCAECFVSFVSDGRALFADNEAAASRVKRFSPDCEDVSIGEFKRSATPALKHIEKELWNDSAAKLTDRNGLEIITARNIFDECEAIASRVTEALRGGLRLRDICVFTGSAAEYSEVLESVLGRRGIPCFTSRKEDVLSKPLFAFVFSCIEIAFGNFELSAVRKYIKSGFSPLTVEEGDLLLRYAMMWSLRGSAWYADSEWMMNPDGFGELTAASAAVLKSVNNSRAKLISILLPLRETLTAEGTTVLTSVRALYDHLCESNAVDTLAKRAERLRAEGDEAAADREEQLYDLLINVFDQLCLLAPDEVIPPRRLWELLQIMCAEYNVGAIPSSVDAVWSGDPRLFRPDNCKMAVICGANDGVFPSYAKSDAFFEESELIALEGLGCNFALPRDSAIRRERFLFYMACTCCSERLVLTFPSGTVSGGKLRRSQGIYRLCAIFSSLEIYEFGKELSDILYSPSSALELYPHLHGELKAAVGNALTAAGFALPKPAEQIFMPDARIDFEHGSEFSLSPTAFERYSYCPFSYFLTYLMRLKKQERLRFAEAQVGTLLHKAIEEYMRKCCAGGIFIGMSASEMNAEAESLILRCFPAAGEPALARLMSGLRRNLVMAYKNLNNEFGVCDFFPVGFEVGIGTGQPGSTRPMSVDVEGTTVFVRGTADRVDAFEKDGVRYIRIVDYKTGKKAFSLSLIAEGIDVQLPMYLFAVCEEQNAKPAACLYYTLKLDYVDRTPGETDEQLEKRLLRSFRRSGLFSDSINCIFAADRSEEGVFRPVRITKKGDIHASDRGRVTNENGFAELKKQLAQQMCKTAESIFNGDMRISPKHIDRAHDACTYCKYKQACRYDGR